MGSLNRIVGSNWTITLVGILIGGFLGVYLTNYFSARTERKESKNAFERVLSELSENHERLLEWDSLTLPYFDCVMDISNFVEDDGNGLILSNSELDTLLAKYVDVLEVTDTINFPGPKEKYYWNMKMQVDLVNAMSSYSDMAWQSLKNSHFQKHVKFECITEVEHLHQLFYQAGINKSKWFDTYLTNVLKIRKRQEVRMYWQLEREFNKRIRASFDEIMQSLENCGK